MQRPEIISGLKNAIERGYPLNLAIQSFVNAGYNKQDVEDSAKALGGVLSYTKIEEKPEATASLPSTPQPMPSLKPLPNQLLSSSQQIQPEKKRRGIVLIIILIVILALLLGFLLASIFAKDFVLSLLEKLGISLT